GEGDRERGDDAEGEGGSEPAACGAAGWAGRVSGGARGGPVRIRGGGGGGGRGGWAPRGGGGRGGGRGGGGGGARARGGGARGAMGCGWRGGEDGEPERGEDCSVEGEAGGDGRARKNAVGPGDLGAGIGEGDAADGAPAGHRAAVGDLRVHAVVERSPRPA